MPKRRGSGAARRVAGEQGDGARARLGRRGQDDHGGRHRARRGGRAGRSGARPDGRSGPSAGRRSRCGSARQHRDASARRRLRGGRRATTRRAVGGDARHQGRVGRPHPAPRSRRQGPRRRAREPALPEHHQPLRAQPRLPGDGAAARPPRVRPVRPGRRRHAAVAQRPVGARCAVSDARVLRQPTVAVAHRALSIAAVHGGVEALLPDRRSGARERVPARHRRLLRALPGDGEGVRRPRPRGRGAAR